MIAVLAAGLVLLGVATAFLLSGYVAVLHQTRAAADLAALAGAETFARGGDPCPVAAEIANSNEARLDACRVIDGGGPFAVTVVVVGSWKVGLLGLPQAVAVEAHAGAAA